MRSSTCIRIRRRRCCSCRSKAAIPLIWAGSCRRRGKGSVAASALHLPLKRGGRPRSGRVGITTPSRLAERADLPLSGGGEARLPLRNSVADLALDRGLQVGVFPARGAAADRTDFFQEILGFQQIALLDVPHPVILPGAHVVRVRRERLLVPDLGCLVITKLAVGIADVIRDFGAVVVTKRPEGDDGRFVLAVERERARRAIAVDELLLGFLLGLLFLRGLAGILLVGRGGWPRRLLAARLRIAGRQRGPGRNRKAEQQRS